MLDFAARGLLFREPWFNILQNMRNFAVNPKHVDKRFTGILEACRQQGTNCSCPGLSTEEIEALK